MRRLGIYTRDFRFYHEILKILKNWDIPFVSITESMEIPKDVAVIISSKGDQSISGEQLRCSDPLSAVRKGISFLIGKDQFNGVVIGIDPGPKPGFAVMADGILIEAFECADKETLVRNVEKAADGYSCRSFLVRVGDGDIPNRNQIIIELKKDGFAVEMIDESNTSQPHKMHDNALSAARIANGGMVSYPVYTGHRRRDLYEIEFTTLRRALIKTA